MRYENDILKSIAHEKARMVLTGETFNSFSIRGYPENGTYVGEQNGGRGCGEPGNPCPPEDEQDGGNTYPTSPMSLANELKNHYKNGNGEVYNLTKDQLYAAFFSAVNNGSIDWDRSKSLGNNSYRVPINFYKADLGFALSFGRATMTFTVGEYSITPTGFTDRWNLDHKILGVRPGLNEAVTRFFDAVLTGESFKIKYP